MKGLWIATIVLWALGLLALPTLIGGPGFSQMLGAERELRPFVMFLGALICLSGLWLVATLTVAFKHRGRDRVLALAVTVGMAVVFLAITPLASLSTYKTTTSTIKVDLPATGGAAH